MKSKNYDPDVVEDFGDEWRRFDQSKLSEKELRDVFDRYFRLFPWDRLPKEAVGFDMGCGSGRWAKLVAPRASKSKARSAFIKTTQIENPNSLR